MWIFTTRGFFSAVEDRRDVSGDTFVVRARAKSDLENLRDLIPDLVVIDDEGGDYPFRIRVSRRTWVEVVARMAVEIDYTNFKDAVKHKRGKKVADVYMRVWSACLSLEPKDWWKRKWAKQDAAAGATLPLDYAPYESGVPAAADRPNVGPELPTHPCLECGAANTCTFEQGECAACRGGDIPVGVSTAGELNEHLRDLVGQKRAQDDGSKASRKRKRR